MRQILVAIKTSSSTIARGRLERQRKTTHQASRYCRGVWSGVWNEGHGEGDVNESIFVLPAVEEVIPVLLIGTYILA